MSEDWRQELLTLPEAITPIYTTPAPNSSISLFDGPIQLDQQGGSTVSGGSISLSWLPSPSVDFSIPKIQGTLDSRQQTQIVVSPLNLQTEVLFRNVTYGSEHKCHGLLSHDVIAGTAGPCEHVILHVPNFVDYIGEVIRTPGEITTRNGRIVFEDKSWRLTLDNTQATSKLIKALKVEGGFALTHTGKLERVDGQNFAFQDVQQVWWDVGFFLSFLRGSWCHSVLPVAILQDVPLWQWWGSPALTQWQTASNWFPHRTPDDLRGITQVFDGYMRKCEDSLWSDPIKTALFWYVTANLNEGGVEGAIILAATALELLGWVYLEQPHINPPKSTVKKGASLKLWQLLELFNIPTTIPSELDALTDFAPQLDAGDGPEAFVYLRNRIVHPPTKQGQMMAINMPIEARRQAWMLGMWYLELILLRLFHYQGYYYCRLVDSGWPGEKRMRVPWV